MIADPLEEDDVGYVRFFHLKNGPSTDLWEYETNSFDKYDRAKLDTSWLEVVIRGFDAENNPIVLVRRTGQIKTVQADSIRCSRP